MSFDRGEYSLVAENGAKDSNGNKIDLEYTVRTVKEFPKTGDTPFTSTPALSPEDSFQFNLSGKNQNPTLTFKIIDNGNDRTDGTHTSSSFSDIAEIADGLGYSSFSDPRFDNDTVTTVEEQEVWLTEYIHNNALPITWRLYGGKYTDMVSNGSGTPIVITQVEPVPEAGRDNEIRTTVRFSLGKRVI